MFSFDTVHVIVNHHDPFIIMIHFSMPARMQSWIFRAGQFGREVYMYSCMLFIKKSNKQFS